MRFTGAGWITDRPPAFVCSCRYRDRTIRTAFRQSGQYRQGDGTGGQGLSRCGECPGGINGQKLKHVVKDDGYKTEDTVRLTKELIEKDKAVALIGYAGTGNISELLKQGVLAGGKLITA